MTNPVHKGQRTCRAYPKRNWLPLRRQAEEGFAKRLILCRKLLGPKISQAGLVSTSWPSLGIFWPEVEVKPGQEQAVLFSR